MTNDENSNQQKRSANEEQPASEDKNEIERPVIKVNPANVPIELHPLIPYVEKWDIPDKERQQALLHETSLAEIEELYRASYPAWQDVNRFTASPPLPNESKSNEIETFNAFRPVFEEASFILMKERPEKWLEIIGWPEAYPGKIFDPTKVPSELHLLIPYAEKWAIDEEGIRLTAIKVATNEELKELVSIVGQLGDEKIRELALKMLDDKTLEEQGYILLILLDATEHAERELKRRQGSTTEYK